MYPTKYKRAKKTELQKAKDKADKYFSLYVRQRDASDEGHVRCCTCGMWHYWKYLDCGHFQSRGYGATRYDEKNTGPQCKDCNIGNQGMQYQFGLYLDGKYGPKTAEKITIKSRMFSKRNRYDYEQIAEQYKQKIKAKMFKV